jgi:hypothetical protein
MEKSKKLELASELAEINQKILEIAEKLCDDNKDFSYLEMELKNYEETRDKILEEMNKAEEKKENEKNESEKPKEPNDSNGPKDPEPKEKNDEQEKEESDNDKTNVGNSDDGVAKNINVENQEKKFLKKLEDSGINDIKENALTFGKSIKNFLITGKLGAEDIKLVIEPFFKIAKQFRDLSKKIDLIDTEKVPEIEKKGIEKVLDTTNDNKDKKTFKNFFAFGVASMVGGLKHVFEKTAENETDPKMKELWNNLGNLLTGKDVKGRQINPEKLEQTITNNLLGTSETEIKTPEITGKTKKQIQEELNRNMPGRK